MNIPKHVAIILDGNGRWAKERGYSRSMGHQEGFNNLRSLSKYIFKCGVEVLSVYAFSTENFKRSKQEVDFLMNLFVKGFKEYAKEMQESNIKVIFSGRRFKPLPKKVISVIEKVEKMTKNGTKGTINICINYGAHAEIIDAIKKVYEDKIDIKLLDEEMFNKYLYQELPPIDLLIRTSGEQRLSNFMLWQAAYAEFYFPKTYFPDFKEKDFDKAIKVYNNRDRRFGGIKEEKNK